MPLRTMSPGGTQRGGNRLARENHIPQGIGVPLPRGCAWGAGSYRGGAAGFLLGGAEHQLPPGGLIKPGGSLGGRQPKGCEGAQ